MKRSRLALLALVLIIAVGCASTPAAIAYRTIGTIKVTVDAGMDAWYARVVANQTTPAQELQVKAAFNKYTSAAAAAAAVMRASTDPAPPNLTTAANALTKLLTSFGVKVGP